MKAAYLRIGNLVTDKWSVGKYPFKIVSIGKNICHYFGNQEFSAKYEDLEPIPLTEEWLLKFGFEKDEYAKDFRLGKYWVENRYFDSYEKSMFLFGCYQFNKIYITSNVDVLKYVHELQNLYFALTGQELTI